MIQRAFLSARQRVCNGQPIIHMLVHSKRPLASLLHIIEKRYTLASNKPTGDNARKGADHKRSQVANTKSGLMTKRNKENGEFMDTKTSGGKFKGVRREK